MDTVGGMGETKLTASCNWWMIASFPARVTWRRRFAASSGPRSFLVQVLPSFSFPHIQMLWVDGVSTFRC
eukprot:4169949-Prorocentrum_lima.AAC.1